VKVRVGDRVLYDPSALEGRPALVVGVSYAGRYGELGIVDLVAWDRRGEQRFVENVPFEHFIPGLPGTWRWRPEPTEES
jgi:hypothetical protein